MWRAVDGSVEHPLLLPGALRAIPFQLDFARIGISEDLLVVLPTGLGKTAIAALVAAEVLRREPGKLLFLAPTRPLVRQHADWFARSFRALRIARFTGTVSRPVRSGGWEAADAVFATPELVANDLAEGRYDLTSVSLLVFDEAHHAVGKYAYVPIAERFRSDRPPGSRLLALTASPGGKDERIDEVVGALGVQRIEARSREDEGVREHVQPVTIEHRWVELPPELARLQATLQEAEREVARKLQRMGYLRKKPIGSLSIKDLISLRSEIFARPGPMTRKFGPLFHQLILLHLHHSLERLETQGVAPFLQYVDRVERKEKPSRGDRAFLAVSGLVEARRDASALLTQTRVASHPKLDALRDLVEEAYREERGRPPRILIFAQFRDTIQGIREALEAQGFHVERFVGQATRDKDDPGMNQKEQARILDEFRAGRFPILVASSVAEEGLDVPDVDIVVFFESIPSEIRAIQRRGRTGRSSLGRVVLLMTTATREVSYQKAETRREKAMGRIVRRLSTESRARSRRRRESSATGESTVSPTADPPPS
ncbi:MAG: DEAD/DEAH box helicase [Thermoplasmata archaeon]|nr:DEAD/DEAH box helicase [Thermoplasmata archaeon]MCI4359192.1 DEAD/DEAH box helicase [Thermoplasmata archaeon]